MDPKPIEQFEQNKPTLVVRDLEKHAGVMPELSYGILLTRGVFKWFAVRRDLIRLKESWKERIRGLHAEIPKAKKNGDPHKLGQLRGELKALVECRQAVQALCHGPRAQAPDNDHLAQHYLESLGYGQSNDKSRT